MEVGSLLVVVVKSTMQTCLFWESDDDRTELLDVVIHIRNDKNDVRLIASIILLLCLLFHLWSADDTQYHLSQFERDKRERELWIGSFSVLDRGAPSYLGLEKKQVHTWTNEGGTPNNVSMLYINYRLFLLLVRNDGP